MYLKNSHARKILITLDSILFCLSRSDGDGDRPKASVISTNHHQIIQYFKCCRTVLMASYLGHIVNVAPLVNENNVYPDIADLQGNTALMYATVSGFYYFSSTGCN